MRGVEKWGQNYINVETSFDDAADSSDGADDDDETHAP